jgi:hypothetical protein
VQKEAGKSKAKLPPVVTACSNQFKLQGCSSRMRRRGRVAFHRSKTSEGKARSHLPNGAIFFRRSPGWSLGRLEELQLLQTQYALWQAVASALAQESVRSSSIRPAMCLPPPGISEDLHDDVRLSEFPSPSAANFLLIFAAE